jgi:hypothetical protein
MGVEEYRVKVYTPNFKYISHPMTMLDAIKYIVDKLNVFNAIDCLNKGVIVPTKCVFRGDETYYKTFVVESNLPYTKLVLKKQSKGSFNIDELLTTIKYVKEEYGRN